MTANQIRYWTLQEEARANKAKEQENVRSNIAKEQENIRSNTAREAETNRSNLENERLAREKLEYDKYGNSSAGGVIRTIKAGLDDTAKLVQKTVDELNKAKSSPTNNQSITGAMGVEANNSVGGLDAAYFRNSKKTNRLENMELSDLKKELESKEKQLLSPTKAPRNLNSVQILQKEIDALKKEIQEREGKTNGAK